MSFSRNIYNSFNAVSSVTNDPTPGAGLVETNTTGNVVLKTLTSTGGTVNITNGPNTINLEQAVGPGAGVNTLNNAVGFVKSIIQGATPIGGNVSLLGLKPGTGLAMSTPAGNIQIDNTGIISLTQGPGITITGGQNATISTAVSPWNFQAKKTCYVSASGSNTNNGGALDPFQTVNYAIGLINGYADATFLVPYTIILYNGVWAENILIPAFTYIQGDTTLAGAQYTGLIDIDAIGWGLAPPPAIGGISNLQLENAMTIDMSGIVGGIWVMAEIASGPGGSPFTIIGNNASIGISNNFTNQGLTLSGAGTFVLYNTLTFPGQSLTLNGALITVLCDIDSIPTASQQIFAGGATRAQIQLSNESICSISDAVGGSTSLINSNTNGLVQLKEVTAGTNITINDAGGLLTFNAPLVATSAPATQIVYGTGPSVGSDANFTWDSTTHACNVVKPSSDGVISTVMTLTSDPSGLHNFGNHLCLNGNPTGPGKIFRSDGSNYTSSLQLSSADAPNLGAFVDITSGNATTVLGGFGSINCVLSDPFALGSAYFRIFNDSIAGARFSVYQDGSVTMPKYANVSQKFLSANGVGLISALNVVQSLNNIGTGTHLVVGTNPIINSTNVKSLAVNAPITISDDGSTITLGFANTATALTNLFDDFTGQLLTTPQTITAGSTVQLENCADTESWTVASLFGGGSSALITSPTTILNSTCGVMNIAQTPLVSNALFTMFRNNINVVSPTISGSDAYTAYFAFYMPVLSASYDSIISVALVADAPVSLTPKTSGTIHYPDVQDAVIANFEYDTGSAGYKATVTPVIAGVLQSTTSSVVAFTANQLITVGIKMSSTGSSCIISYGGVSRVSSSIGATIFGSGKNFWPFISMYTLAGGTSSVSIDYFCSTQNYSSRNAIFGLI